MNQPADKPREDYGPWRMIVGNNDVTLYSDDFTHDVAITISGDFSDNEQRIAYATRIQQRLSSPPSSGGDAIATGGEAKVAGIETSASLPGKSADVTGAHGLSGHAAALHHEKLEQIANALDKALGDSDLTHIEDDDELREVAPVQWACAELNKLLQITPSAIETSEERRLRHRIEKIDKVLDELGAPKTGDWDGINCELSQVGRIKALVARSATLHSKDLPEGRRSPPAGALESGSPHAVARDSNPGSAVPGGEESQFWQPRAEQCQSGWRASLPRLSAVPWRLLLPAQNGEPRQGEKVVIARNAENPCQAFFLGASRELSA